MTRIGYYKRYYLNERKCNERYLNLFPMQLAINVNNTYTTWVFLCSFDYKNIKINKGYLKHGNFIREGPES